MPEGKPLQWQGDLTKFLRGHGATVVPPTARLIESIQPTVQIADAAEIQQGPVPPRAWWSVSIAIPGIGNFATFHLVNGSTMYCQVPFSINNDALGGVLVAVVPNPAPALVAPVPVVPHSAEGDPTGRGLTGSQGHTVGPTLTLLTAVRMAPAFRDVQPFYIPPSTTAVVMAEAANVALSFSLFAELRHLAAQDERFG